MDHSRTFFVHSAEIEQYHYPPDSPFKTERAARTREVLSSMGYFSGVLVAPERATEEEMLWFHTRYYLDTIRRAAAGDVDPEALFVGLGTPETPVFRDLFDYASLACGGTLRAARLIIDGDADLVFNPSGGYHHALPEQAGGFCYINDVVLAGKLLNSAGKRVFCLDLDAHHGNGTQHAFYESAEVFTVSMHESGRTLYPWNGFETEIGAGAGTGYNVNVPCPPGTDDDAYRAAFVELVPSLIRAYQPDAILLEIGMDILSTDPLTHLGMTNNVLADVLPLVTQFEKPILAVGGGGYQPEDTARGWALSWATLCGLDLETDLYVGLGGTFMGTTEFNAGLRDMHSYRHGAERDQIYEELGRAVSHIKKHVFPVHGITE